MSVLRNELKAVLTAPDTSGLPDIFLPEETRDTLLASLYSGHHLLLAGPPGSGKTVLAQKIVSLIGDAAKISGCPVNCPVELPSCPWCLQRLAAGETLTAEALPAAARVHKIQGSQDLAPEDLMGDLDPAAAFALGLRDIRAFQPGKLLRANRGFLLIDFIDRLPHRALNVLLFALAGDPIGVGEDHLALDLLVLATGGEGSLRRLPRDLLDHFDVVRLNYISDTKREQQLIAGQTGPVAKELFDPAYNIVRRTRTHPDLARGAGTRGAVRLAELLFSYQQFWPLAPGQIIRRSAAIALPHRVRLSSHAETGRKPNEIITEIVEQELGATNRGNPALTFTREDVLALAEEIISDDKIRKSLKYGFFDLLLKRIQRLPESRLAALHSQMKDYLEQLANTTKRTDSLTDELLEAIEAYRKDKEQRQKESAKFELAALEETVRHLARQGVFEPQERGFALSRRSIALFLEKLAPKHWENARLAATGGHRAGQKAAAGEGRIIGVRPYRTGDRYRDLDLRSTLRQALRHRRLNVRRDDLMIQKRDRRTRLDIVVVLDLSGTMAQLEKLWYAKESALALALAGARYGDRMGVVVFSNRAEVVVDLTGNTYRLTQKILDLDLHDKAFTNIGYGLLVARSLFLHHRRQEGNQHLILVSDGDATAPHPSPQRYALKETSKTVRKGITISCICINEKNADPELMRRIARIGKGRLYLVGAGDLAAAMLEDRMAIK